MTEPNVATDSTQMLPHAPPHAPHRKLHHSRGGGFAGPVVRFQNGVTVVELPRQIGAGRHGLHVWTEVTHLVRSEQRVVLNLTHVPLLDRIAMGGLLRCLRRMQKRGTTFVLCGLSKELEATLELVGVSRYVRVEPTTMQAVRALMT